MRIHRPVLTGVVFSLFMCGVVIVGAQPATPRPRTTADGIYSAAQAQRGEQRFNLSCVSCHTPSSFGNGAFAGRWAGQTMADVFEFVSNAMPENDPGSLKSEEYADVLAFILSISAYPPGREDLSDDKDALRGLQITPSSK